MRSSVSVGDMFMGITVDVRDYTWKSEYPHWRVYVSGDWVDDDPDLEKAKQRGLMYVYEYADNRWHMWESLTDEIRSVIDAMD